MRTCWRRPDRRRGRKKSGGRHSKCARLRPLDGGALKVFAAPSIIIELAEILQIDLALGRVSQSRRAARNHLRHMLRHGLNGPDDVGELAHAGGLNEDAVGVKQVHHLFQRLAKVPRQGAADAPGVHLGDLRASHSRSVLILAASPRASNSEISSAVSTISAAFAAASTCSTFVTPIMGKVPLAIAQAVATCAGEASYLLPIYRIFSISFSS